MLFENFMSHVIGALGNVSGVSEVPLLSRVLDLNRYDNFNTHSCVFMWSYDKAFYKIEKRIPGLLHY